MKITPYKQVDLAEVVAVFQASVHGISQEDYSIDQLNAWAPSAEITRRTARWRQKLQAPYTLLAKQNGKIAGFIHYRADGYLDLLFIHPTYQGQSIARKLVTAVEAALHEMGVTEIRTDASITARPFFEALGYQLVKKQSVQRQNQVLINYQMTKKLLKNRK